MTFGSLYSGIGGACLGLEAAGYRCAWRAESDPWRRAILAARFPGTALYIDVAGLPDNAATIDGLVADPPTGDPGWFEAVWPIVERMRPAWLFFTVGSRCRDAFASAFERFGYLGVGAVIAVTGQTRFGPIRFARSIVIAQRRDQAQFVVDVSGSDLACTITEPGRPPLSLPEVAEAYRGLPIGWTCMCGASDPFQCAESAARLLAVNDCVSPAIAWRVGVGLVADTMAAPLVDTEAR